MRKGIISLVLQPAAPSQCLILSSLPDILTPIFFLDLLVDRLLQRHFPGGNLDIPSPAPSFVHERFDRFMSPPYLRTTLQMSRSMVNMSNWLSGILLARKTTIVSGPSVTPTHTSSSFASPLTRQIRLITYRKKCVHILSILVTYTDIRTVFSGSQKLCTSARGCLSSSSDAKRILDVSLE